MNNNVKNFAIAALATGVALIFGGAWLNVTWVIAGGGLLLIGLLLLLHLLVNLKFAQRRVVKDKPVSSAELERGRKELVDLLNSMIEAGCGDRLVHLDLMEKKSPSEVLKGLTNNTEESKADLEYFTLKNRKNWREHYSEEEWLFAKNKALEELRKCKDQMKEIVYFGTDHYTPRQLIECIKSEDEIGVKHVLSCARLEFRL